MASLKGDGGLVRVVNTHAAPMVVTITLNDQTPTVYSASDQSDTLSMPLTITETTDFWLGDPAKYTVSVTVNGVEAATGRGNTRSAYLSHNNSLVIEPEVNPRTITDLSGTYRLVTESVDTRIADDADDPITDKRLVATVDSEGAVTWAVEDL